MVSRSITAKRQSNAVRVTFWRQHLLRRFWPRQASPNPCGAWRQAESRHNRASRQVESTRICARRQIAPIPAYLQRLTISHRHKVERLALVRRIITLRRAGLLPDRAMRLYELRCVGSLRRSDLSYRSPEARRQSDIDHPQGGNPLQIPTKRLSCTAHHKAASLTIFCLAIAASRADTQLRSRTAVIYTIFNLANLGRQSGARTIRGGKPYLARAAYEAANPISFDQTWRLHIPQHLGTQRQSYIGLARIVRGGYPLRSVFMSAHHEAASLDNRRNTWRRHKSRTTPGGYAVQAKAVIERHNDIQQRKL
jgi:hypothetical protein